MLCVTKVYVLPDVDVIILDFFFKNATLELIEVLPAKEKSILKERESHLKFTSITMKSFTFHYGINSVVQCLLQIDIP